MVFVAWCAFGCCVMRLVIFKPVLFSPDSSVPYVGRRGWPVTSERGWRSTFSACWGAGGHPGEKCEGSAFPQTSINTTEMDGNPALLPRWALLNGREPLVLPQVSLTWVGRSIVDGRLGFPRGLQQHPRLLTHLQHLFRARQGWRSGFPSAYGLKPQFSVVSGQQLLIIVCRFSAFLPIS